LVVARRFFLAISIPTATFLTMVIRILGPLATSTRFVFPEILVVVLPPILNAYYNDCARAYNLGTAAKIKIMGEPS
jgi:hypothetical protein